MRQLLGLVLSGWVRTALAHGGVLSYQIASPSSYIQGFAPYTDPTTQSVAQREWDSDNPIYDPTDPHMACNANGNPGAQTATIAAGSTITAYWNNPWLHSIGPLVTWMTAVDTAISSAAPPPSASANTSGAGARWFKLDQAGLLAGTVSTGLWGMGQMLDGNSSWTSTVPVVLKPGAYLLRNEVIALHQAGHPQFYMQCLQLNVTGNGTASPPAASLAAIPGVYRMDDPEISIDIYAEPDKTTYNIPGPSPWTG